METKLVSVSDINSYLFCPRKLFLVKVCGLQVPVNRNMTIGRIKHSILENFSKKEEEFVSKIDKNYENLEFFFLYEDFIKSISERVFADNFASINKFMIDPEDILKKVLRDFEEDIRIRIRAIKEVISKGYTKEQIFPNLDSIYLSELKIDSQVLGLKGRVDRVIINKKDGSIVPFELKSREDKVYPSDELQLTAYALLLQEKYNKPVEKGIVEVGNNKQEVLITQENKDKVLFIAEQIRNLDKNPIPPMQSNFNKCRFCEFQQECGKL